MTDDSDAERSALSSSFPLATLLVCKFHVQRAVWRWLWDSEHGIVKEDRRVLMKLFQTITNAESVELLHEAVMTMRYNTTAAHYNAFIT